MFELIETSEHKKIPYDTADISPILFKKKVKKKADEYKCIDIHIHNRELIAHYYVGVDWLKREELAVYVAPKMNNATQETDYIKMLFSCLKHPDIISDDKNGFDDLYEIKFDEPFIELKQQKQDLLTPLLIVQFLHILKRLVRKGLRKSYYKVEKNLNARIKGQVLVSQTITQNILKNKPTKTYCRYDEFGFNGIENRILKKTLVFIQKYIASFPHCSTLIQPILNYCSPAFEEVDGDIDVYHIHGLRHNSFFKEYKSALHLSNLILKRFGYAISEIKSNDIKVPPFWIDMSKLFELYVLGLLKDKYSKNIKFQIQGNYGQPDFILVDGNSRFIIDAKYKVHYKNKIIDDNKAKTKDRVKDIRQISGYARDTKILEQLGYSKNELPVVDCLIIYPDQSPCVSEILNDKLKESPIEEFIGFYKMPIRLPVIV